MKCLRSSYQPLQTVAKRARHAGLLAALIALGGCVTADVEVVTVTTVKPPPPVVVATSPPIDAIPDDLETAKMHFRAAHYGLAELHFRRVVEKTNGSVEAWLGLAASYDKLKRYDLADRAYARAFKLAGPISELLNNRGYSYLLRGNLARASADLSAAVAADPDNESARNNLRLLDARLRRAL
jgi:Flp pilus assembly protein TadD